MAKLQNVNKYIPEVKKLIAESTGRKCELILMCFRPNLRLQRKIRKLTMNKSLKIKKCTVFKEYSIDDIKIFRMQVVLKLI